MLRKTNIVIATVLAVAFLVLCVSPLSAQSAASKRALITQNVDESNRVTLSGNTRPEVRFAKDRGPVSDEFPLSICTCN